MAIAVTIVHPDSAQTPVLQELFPARHYECSYRNLESTSATEWALPQHQAVIYFAVPFTDSFNKLFDPARGLSLEVPTLAILPTDAGERLISRAIAQVDDFILWPARAAEVRHRLDRLTCPSTIPLEERLREQLSAAQMVGNDPEFLRSIARIPALARAGVPVLISGETGTGKELCARAIHQLGSRRDQGFVAVDCAALPDHLFENEVFGHSRGAFTDAHRDQKGLVALADKGTMFFDEIDSLSTAAQSKLLRFVQERTYRPLGSDRFLQADVRILAGTNKRLDRLVSSGSFRSDLLFRLDVLRIELPPLRDRISDVELLAAHLLSLMAAAGEGPKRLTHAALRRLVQHRWPGNVRELNNVLQRAQVLAEGRDLLPVHIVFDNEPAVPPPTCGDTVERFQAARERCLAEFEREYVEQVLRKNGGNVTSAAAEAGKERRAFGRLVKKYRIAKGAS